MFCKITLKFDISVYKCRILASVIILFEQNGGTALRYAVGSGHWDIVWLLLEYSAVATVTLTVRPLVVHCIPLMFPVLSGRLRGAVSGM